MNDVVGTSHCENADKCRGAVKITSANVTLLCHKNSARFQYWEGSKIFLALLNCHGNISKCRYKLWLLAGLFSAGYKSWQQNPWPQTE